MANQGQYRINVDHGGGGMDPVVLAVLVGLTAVTTGIVVYLLTRQPTPTSPPTLAGFSSGAGLGALPEHAHLGLNGALAGRYIRSVDSLLSLEGLQ